MRKNYIFIVNNRHPVLHFTLKQFGPFITGHLRHGLVHHCTGVLYLVQLALGSDGEQTTVPEYKTLNITINIIDRLQSVLVVQSTPASRAAGQYSQ